MTTELIVDFAIDLYLHLISISRRFMHGFCDFGAIWLPLLALSWVHDDEAIRREGYDMRVLPCSNVSPILDSLGLIISPRSEDKRGEINLPAETRRRIISSDPFRILFNWQDRTGPMLEDGSLRVWF